MAGKKKFEVPEGILVKLSGIQKELVVPKKRLNDKGGFMFRNCEDILEAVKPICEKYRTTLLLSDEVVYVGNRNYIKATATLYDWDDTPRQNVFSYGYARENIINKEIDDSQATGMASSYARKYALCGLFNIDDGDDPDVKGANGKEIDIDKVLTEAIYCKYQELDKLGVDITDYNVSEYIKKHNNGKTNFSEMNKDEKQNYIKVLDDLIRLRGEANAK